MTDHRHDKDKDAQIPPRVATDPPQRPGKGARPPGGSILCGALQTQAIDVGALSTAGLDLSSFGPFPGAVLFLGSFSGLQWSMRGGGAGAAWVPAGLTPVFYDGSSPLYVRRSGSGAGGSAVAVFVPYDGSIPIREWLYELGIYWRGSPGPSASGSLGPNRNQVFSEAVPAGVKSHDWTIAGFLYATVLNPVGNAGTIFIGESAVPTYPLVVGAAENFFVGAAFGFFYDGTLGDTIQILEYGRS